MQSERDKDRERAKARYRRNGITAREELYIAAAAITMLIMMHGHLLHGDAGPLWWQGILLVVTFYYFVKVRFAHDAELRRLEKDERLTRVQNESRSE